MFSKQSFWLLCTIFLFFAGGTLTEAGKLSGIVLDSLMREPVEGVSVVVIELGIGVETDVEGLFEFNEIPPGIYLIRISHVGFQHLESSEVVVDETDPVLVEFLIQPEPIFLNELEVVAEPIGPVDIQRLPAFVTILRREMFEGRVTTVPALLSTTTGVQINRLGGLGSFSSVSIRGSSSEQVEVFLDGVSLNPALGGGVNLSNLPLSNVEQIEVYRGAETKGGGMGGSIHIRTRSVRGKRQYGGTGSWGSFNTRGASAMVSERRDRNEYLMILDYAASKNNFRFLDDNGTEYNPNDDTWTYRQNSQFVSGSALGKFGLRFGNARVILQENFFWKRQGIPGISNNQSKHARLNTTRSLTEVSVMAPNWLDGFSVHQKIFLNYRAELFFDRMGEVGIGLQENLYRTWSYGWRGKLKTVLATGHAAALELLVQREAFLPESRIENSGKFLESTRHTISGQVGTDLMLPKGLGILSASAKIKFQKNKLLNGKSYPFVSLSPDSLTDRTLEAFRAGVRIDLMPGFWFKANLGRSQRLPSFHELFGDRGGVIGNSELRSESGVSWDVGLRLQSSRGKVLEGVYFSHWYTNLIQFVQFSQGVGRAQNIGKARVQGVETSLSGFLFGRWSVSGNYTFQQATDYTKISHRRGKRLPNRPAHEVHFHIALPLEELTIFYDYTFEDGNFLDRANLRAISVRQIHNVGFRWPLFQGIQLTLEAKNLGNDQVADLWGYPLPGRSLFLTLQESF